MLVEAAALVRPVWKGCLVGTASAHLMGDRYRLDTVLGRGGIATVWAGVDIRLDRPVAVKVLGSAATADPAMLRLLDQEARTLARLAHPNIVAVYDLGTEADVPYVVMELVEGDDLRQRLARGPLDPPEAVRIATQICDALQAAHEAGVVHRDIKPDNVLLTRSGIVKICDFGIARLQQSSTAQATAHGSVIGTASYMAPEQASGGPVDARADLYALGCVLYEMLASRPPFTGDDAMRVLWQHVHDAPAPVASQRSDVPAELDALVQQLLTKRPEHRPASARQVRASLAELGGAATPPSATASEGEWEMGRGRATVITRTRTMPAVDAAVDDAVDGSFRLGPAGVLGVAVGAALLTALLIAVTMLVTRPDQPAGSADGGSAAASPTSAPQPTTRTVSDVRAVIQAQVQSGQVDASAANDLLNRLDDVERHFANGRLDRALDQIDKLREKVETLARDGRITSAGRAAVLDSLDELTNTYRETGNGDDED